VNSDLIGPHHFDLFSDPGRVGEEAASALDTYRRALAQFEGSGGEPTVWLPTLRLALRAADHILGMGFDSNRVGGEDDLPLHADRMAVLTRALNRAALAIEMMTQERGPEAVAELRGDVRVGYRSPVDDTDQPLCLYVPEDYTADREWPLMVRLHGAWSEIDEAQWTIQTYEWDREFTRFAPRGLFIELYPWGRGNVWYRGPGGQDVIDVLDVTESLFSVDPDRVYLMGSSMGADGGWRLAASHPERFAAFCGVVGIYDTDLLEGLSQLPIMFHYGHQDKRDRVTSPQETAERLRQVGGTVELIGHPDSGHRIETTDYQLSYYQFFARHPRQDADKTRTRRV
jgi:poly(3-hydroxybutyrate) depolymerase